MSESHFNQSLGYIVIYKKQTHNLFIMILYTKYTSNKQQTDKHKKPQKQNLTKPN